ncbi:neurotrypsin-like, partial [Saccostrea cucullata]|uniref:neurotrypsin-like n=1 Tax=Saccostrea cuccullata TaxID=36930 RepID=UPI002ED51451
MAVFDIYLFILIISMNFTSYPVSCDDSINGDSVSWSEWTEWSRCNRPCPWSWCRNTTCIGAKTRRRTCTDSVTDNSTLICSGSFKQNVLCIKAVCPVKGEWSGWTEWSACSVTCGNGYRQRIRFCADRRKPCRGKNFEKANCNAELSCPSDGQFGEWGQWSECSQPCSGVRKRQRNCTYPKPRQGDKNCSGNWEETQNCSDVSCEAQSPTMRLIGGNSTTEGRVEVYYNGSWGTVCDDNFGDKDAAVVCHMLGFSRLNAKAKGSAFFGQGSGHIWMDEMGCTDSDTNLFRCSQNAIGSHNCGHNEDAGVMCQTFSGLNIRLVGGSNAMEGRVEIFYNDEWGTVCDDAWDNNDAAVVCFMLGFSRKNATARTSAHFGQVDSRMRIWTDDVRCQGDEMDLLQCNKSSMGTHNCGHSEDAGVICSLDEAVRLVGGNTALEGRVEIYHEGSWGTICDDGWGNEDAAVICSMLGFS